MATLPKFSPSIKTLDEMTVRIFKKKSLPSYFSTELFVDETDVFRLITEVDNRVPFFFNVVEEESFRTETVRVKDVLCKALRMKCLMLNKDVTVSTPVYQTGECS